MTDAPITMRTFLVVVDDSDEMRAALHFACLRARKTGGRVALLRVIEPMEVQHFLGVGELMREEARQEAEKLLHRMGSEVYEYSGQMPVLYVREGNLREQLMTLISDEPQMSILVLAAGTGSDGPGPLISALACKHMNRLRIPMTIVPGGLSNEAIEQLA